MEKEILNLISEASESKVYEDDYYESANNEFALNVIKEILKMYNDGMSAEDIKFCLYRESNNISSIWRIKICRLAILNGYTKEQILFMLNHPNLQNFTWIDKALEHNLSFENIKTALNANKEICDWIIIGHINNGLSFEQFKPFLDIEDILEFIDAIKKHYGVDLIKDW